MYKAGLIKDSDRVHLLGCALPQEFSYYPDFPFIESIDTSNPIIHGLKGKQYKSFGLLEKDPTKIDKIGIVHLDQKILYNINHNITKFKHLITDAYKN
jgi:hypothetical protein